MQRYFCSPTALVKPYLETETLSCELEGSWADRVPFFVSSVSVWIGAKEDKAPVGRLCIDKSAQVFARSVVSVNFFFLQIKENNHSWELQCFLFISKRKLNAWSLLKVVKGLLLAISSRKGRKLFYLSRESIFLDAINMLYLMIFVHAILYDIVYVHVDMMLLHRLF